MAPSGVGHLEHVIPPRRRIQVEATRLEVVADIPYPPTTQDWPSIAAQIRDANPDFVFNSAIGVDTVNLIQAFEQLGYRPPMMFSLFPAPGPLLGVGEPATATLKLAVCPLRTSTGRGCWLKLAALTPCSTVRRAVLLSVQASAGVAVRGMPHWRTRKSALLSPRLVTGRV